MFLFLSLSFIFTILRVSIVKIIINKTPTYKTAICFVHEGFCPIGYSPLWYTDD